jgi:peptidoglycan hydrolase-like protein with peptidoglycan-binding domain
VDAALAIKNNAGQSVWSWGGSWRKPDRMHFQLDRGPDAIDIDWSTVPGQAVVLTTAPGIEPTAFPSEEDENVLGNGAEGKAVTLFQERLRVWDPDALPQWGADGDYGEETEAWVRRFQADLGLDVTGSIDGVTAAVLFGEAPG